MYGNVPDARRYLFNLCSVIISFIIIFQIASIPTLLSAAQLSYQSPPPTYQEPDSNVDQNSDNASKTSSSDNSTSGNVTACENCANTTACITCGNTTLCTACVNGTACIQCDNETICIPCTTSNTTPDSDDTNQQPLVSDNTTSPVSSDNGTAPASSDNTTESPPEDSPTVPIQSDNISTPVPTDNATTPVQTDNSTSPTPTTGGNTTTSIATDNATTPVGSDNTTTPIQADNTTQSVIGENATLPLTSTNTTANVTSPTAPSPTPIQIPTIPAAPTPIYEKNKVRLKVLPDHDAVLTTANGKIELTVPAGAVSEDAFVEIIELEPDYSTGMRQLSFIELNAWSSAAEAPITTFDRPITITIQHTVSDLKGIDVNSLRLYYLDPSQSNNWVPVTRSVFDKTTMTLTAQINHFSHYGEQASPAISEPGRVMAAQVNLHSGASMFDYPIELPSGPGGFQPEIKLVYNGAGVDEMKNKRDTGSWVGIGWKLELGKISYDPDTEKYFLDLPAGSYEIVDHGDGEYHTNPDQFYTICSADNITWQMWDRSGTYFEFGDNASGALQYQVDHTSDNETTYYRFYLNLIRDTNGNQASVNYTRDITTTDNDTFIRSVYPDTLTYANVTVNFTTSYYEDDPLDGHLRKDSPKFYGATPAPPIMETRQLDSIYISVNSTPIRGYSLNYTTTDRVFSSDYGAICYAGKHTLTSITQLGTDFFTGLPMMSFTYEGKNTYRCDDDDPYTGNPGNPATLNWPRLTEIDNGFGGTVGFTYTQNPSSSVNNTWTRQVVTTKSVNDGYGADNYTYTYTGNPDYLGSDWDQQFRGWNEVQETDPAGHYSKHYFYTTGVEIDTDAELFTGREYKTEWYSSNDTLLRTTSSNYSWISTSDDFTHDSIWFGDGYGSYVDVDSDGYVYVSDTGNNTIRKFYPHGGLVTSWSSNSCRGLVVNGDYVYVTDSVNHKVYKYSKSGNLTSTWNGTSGNTTYFYNPQDIDIDGNYAYITSGNFSGGNYAVAKWNLTTGNYSSGWGTEGTGNGEFSHPRGIAAADNTVYVVNANGSGLLEGWDYRYRIEIDSSKVNSDLAQFPAMIFISSNCSQNDADMTAIFDELGSNSQKIAVTEDDGTTQLYVEIEKWDSVNEEAWLWVSSENWTISSSANTTIYLYYDSDHSDNTIFVGDPGDPAAEKVWDDNFVLVDHMRDLPDTDSTRDSTSNDNDGDKVNSDEPLESEAKVSDGQEYDGSNDAIRHGSNGLIESASSHTIEAIVNRDVTGTGTNIYTECVNSPSMAQTIIFAVTASDKVLHQTLHYEGGWNWHMATGTTSLSSDTWYYVAGRLDYSSDTDLFLNGIQDGTDTNNLTTTYDPTHSYSGAYFYNGTPYPDMNGHIDELRLSDTARSDAWLKATYYTCWDNFLAINQDEIPQTRIQKFSSSGSYQMGWGSFGSDDGELDSPCDIDITDTGTVVVADQNNGRIQSFNATGGFLQSYDVLYNPSGVMATDDYIYAAGGYIEELRKNWTIHLDQTDSTIDSDTSRTRYLYDDYGNVITIYQDGDISTGDDDSTIHRTYYPLSSTNITNKIKRERVYATISDDDGGSNLKKETLYYYDGHNSDQSVNVTEGNLTRVARSTSVSSSVSSYFTYDEYGNKVSEQDPNGYTTNWTYDVTHHTYPISVTYNATGLTESYTYVVGTNNLESVTDFNGSTTNYTYDTFQRPLSVIKPGDTFASPSTNTTYENWGTLGQQHVQVQIKISASNNTWTKQYFDGLGRTLQTHSQGETDHTVISGTVDYNSRSLVDKQYVTQDSLSSELDGYEAPGADWRYGSTAYDGIWRITDVINPDNSSVDYAFSGWSVNVTKSSGNLTGYYYDAFDRLIKVEEYSDNDTLYATTRYDYDVLGNLIQVTDNHSNTTSMTYDWLSRKTSMVDPDMGGWSYTYDNAGNLATQTDNKSQTITFTYDGMNRLIGKTYDDGITQNVIYQYDDSTSGNYSLGKRTSMSDALGANSTRYYYDQRGHLIEEKKTIDAVTYSTNYTYDGLDRVATITYPTGEVVTQTYNNRGLPYTMNGTLAGILVSNTLYNHAGSVAQIDYGNDVRTSYEYWSYPGSQTDTEGNYVLTVDAGTGGAVINSHITSYTENATVNLNATQDSGYAFASWSGDTATVADIYDPTTTITMSGNYSVNANFAAVQTQSVYLAPDSDSVAGLYRNTGANNYSCVTTNDGDSSYVYIDENIGDDWYGLSDPAVNPSGTINSVVLKFVARTETSDSWYVATAEAFIKIGSNTYPGPGYEVEPTASYVTYTAYTWTTNPDTSSAWTWSDIEDLQIGLKLHGWLEEEEGWTSYPRCTQVYVQVNYTPVPTTTHDLTISSTGGSTVTDPGEGTFTCSEGAVIDLNAIPNSGYEFVNWTGDTGTIASVNSSATTITMNDDYSIVANYQGGSSFYNSYGKIYRITTVADLGAGTSYQDMRYTWDAAGNLISRYDYAANETETFGYDYLDRLTSASSAVYSHTYSYDEIGNIINMNGNGYSYGTKPHAVTTVNTTNYTYDDNGNMLTGDNRSITWNAENRPISITVNTTTTTFVYDGNGNRVKQTVGDVTTTYVNQFYEKTGTSNVTTHYYLGGRLVTKRENSTVKFIHQDHLTSTALSTDSGGNSLGAMKYYPFGDRLESQGSVGTDILFTGQRLDTTGLYYYGARYYDPTIGRFISADTIVPDPMNPQSLNRYAYCLNNPLKYIDPSGFDPVGHVTIGDETYIIDQDGDRYRVIGTDQSTGGWYSSREEFEAALGYYCEWRGVSDDEWTEWVSGKEYEILVYDKKLYDKPIIITFVAGFVSAGGHPGWSAGTGTYIKWEYYAQNHTAEYLVTVMRHEWFHRYEYETQPRWFNQADNTFWNKVISTVLTDDYVQYLHPNEMQARMYAGETRINWKGLIKQIKKDLKIKW